MARDASLAEQYRAHRAAFELALELGCTPRQAAQTLRDRERAKRRTCGTRAPEPAADADFEPTSEPQSTFGDFGCRWMMRD